MEIIAGVSDIAAVIKLPHRQQLKLIQCLRSLEKNYHYLLIDTAAGIDKTQISLLLAAPYLLLTITEAPTSLSDAFSLLRALKKYHFHRPVLVIVNMADSRQSAQAAFKRFKAAVNKYLHLQSHLAGYILTDKNIPVSILKQQAILLNYPDSAASQSILQICKHLLTFFFNKHQNDTPLSNYFAALSRPDDSNDFSYGAGITLAAKVSESRQCKTVAHHIHCESELAEHSALLRACYFARLLGEKKEAGY